ncbi:MAG: DUF433 domain-containing protein [Planctomycetota bacterium]
MSATQVDIGTMIVRTPETCGGDARIEGTRVRVRDVVISYRRGDTPEETITHFPTLSIAQVYVALAYYHVFSR